MNGIFNHLWQSSAFTAIVGLAAWALRRNSPRARYWLWLAASLKFLVPFSWIVSTDTWAQLPPGLDGQYDFKLEWEPTDAIAKSDPDATSSGVMGVSVATALKQQLGLRLVSKKGPVQVYVVEKIDRPSEN